MTKLRALQANIVTLQVDAIVNAANSSLLGAEALTARFTAPPVLSFWKNAGRSVVARPAMPNSPKDTNFPRSSSFTPWDRSGMAEKRRAGIARFLLP